VALLNLLNDLLDLSRMDADQLTIESVAYSPAALVEEVARMMSPQAKRERLHLEWHASKDLPRQAVGDPLRVRQVLLNLAGNALKFTAEGRVDLFASTQADAGGTRLRFEVTDTGPGIPARDREAVFVRFRQLDASQSRRYGGAGLGLAISKELVTAMGGEIGVDSEPGKGSRFWFTVPAAAPADPAEGVASHGAVRVGS
jgi:signal transduction histidine kinase